MDATTQGVEAVAALLKGLKPHYASLDELFASHANEAGAVAQDKLEILLGEELQLPLLVVQRLLAICPSQEVHYVDFMQNVIMGHIGLAIQQQNVNLRVVFKAHDERSYGYLTRHQLVLLLRTVVDLPTPDIDFLLNQVDPNSRDKIRYDQFVAKFLRSETHQLRREAWKVAHNRTLRAVVVITRHGARFPLKPFPRDNHWPQEKEFWTNYGGRLTPVGCQQHTKLGDMLRAKYLERDQLLEVDAPNLSERVEVYTSNSDRTLMSAQSLLLGLFPASSPQFILDEDSKFAERQRNLRVRSETLSRIRSIESGSGKRISTSIPIHVASETYSPLLHGFKSNAAYETIKDDVFERAPDFRAWAEEERFCQLAEKLWQSTGFEKIDPEKSMRKRLQSFQSVSQQINIERAHAMELLFNADDVTLDVADEEALRLVADTICRLRYCGLNNDDQRRLARLAAGTLPSTIINSFQSIVDAEERNGRLTVYSAHDNSLMAMLAQLGFKDFPIPSFAAHLCFELHEPVPGQYRVRVLYNPDPDVFGFADDEAVLQGYKETVHPCRVPGPGQVCEWLQRDFGDMEFEEFKNILMLDRRSFPDEPSWVEATSGDPWALDVEPVAVPGTTQPMYMVDGVPRYVLRPFDKQVAGHVDTIMLLGDTKLCKPLNDQEHAFYMLLFGDEQDAAVVPRTVSQPFTAQAKEFLNAHLDQVQLWRDCLKRWMPRYFGTIHVQQEDMQIASSNSTSSLAEATPSRPKFTRRFTVSVPESYASPDPTSFKGLRRSSIGYPALPLEEVPSHAEDADMLAMSHRGVVVGWDKLLWFSEMVRDSVSTPPLGELNLREHVAQVLRPTDERLANIAWPQVPGQGFGLVTESDAIVPLYFASQVLCLKWYNACRGLINSLPEEEAALYEPSLVRESTISSLEKALLTLKEAEEFLVATRFGTKPVERKQAWPMRTNSLRQASSQATNSARKPREQRHVFVVLENLLVTYDAPCILDLKLGTRQHGDDATPEKRARQLAKCQATTSGSLGIRCCGMRLAQADGSVEVYDKFYGRQLTKETFESQCLRKFFSVGEGSLRREVIESLAVKLDALISDLKRLDGFRFYSCSLLVVYNGRVNDLRAELRLIDFAKTIHPASPLWNADVHKGSDAGQLFGLTQLHRMLTRLVSESEA